MGRSACLLKMGRGLKDKAEFAVAWSQGHGGSGLRNGAGMEARKGMPLTERGALEGTRVTVFHGGGRRLGTV